MPPSYATPHLSPFSTTFIPFLISIFLARLAHAQGCSPSLTACPADDDLFPNFTFSAIDELIGEPRRFAGGIEFDVQNLEDDSLEPIRYRVVPCGCGNQSTDQGGDIIRIFTQPDGIYADSGPILGLYLALFPDADRLVEVNSKSNVFDQGVRNRIDEGDIAQSRNERGEIPDMAVFDSKVTTAIIPLTAFLEYDRFRMSDDVPPALAIPIERTTTPLERAECIKLIALLFDRLDEATQLFNDLEQRYEAIKAEVVRLAIRRPSVFFNYPTLRRTDSTPPPVISESSFEWTQPTSDSYLISLLEDASAEFRIVGSENGEFSYDDIEDYYSSAKFLLNTGRKNDLSDNTTMTDFINDLVDDSLSEEDQGHTTFNDRVVRRLTATRCGNVWSNQKRIQDSANDFDEAGTFQADRLLLDFVKILHPEIALPDSPGILFQYSYGEATDRDNVPECRFTILQGNPPTGKEFVDKRFRIPGQSRFDIEDEAAGILQNITARVEPEFGIGERELELYFPGGPADTVESTAIHIRASVAKENVEAYNRSENILAILQCRYSGDDDEEVVREPLPTPAASATPSTSPSPSANQPANAEGGGGGGGVGGGAIFGIVVAVLVVMSAVCFCAVRRRRRSHVPIEGGVAVGQGNSDWADGAGGASVAPEQASGSGDGPGRRDRFRPRMKFGRSAPVPPHPDGPGGVGSDDPFI